MIDSYVKFDKWVCQNWKTDNFIREDETWKFLKNDLIYSKSYEKIVFYICNLFFHFVHGCIIIGEISCIFF